MREVLSASTRPLARLLGVARSTLFYLKKKPDKDWAFKCRIEVVYPNLLMQIVPSYQGQVWVADFTHVYFKERDIRVATTMDVFTRDIVGVAIGTRGGTVLVTQALCAALLNHPRPVIFHMSPHQFARLHATDTLNTIVH